MVVLQMWEDLIQKAKDGGLDAIDTYVFWNVHEPSPGNVSIYISDTKCKCCYFWTTEEILRSFNFRFHSITLREDMIWFGSLSWSRRQDYIYIFELDLIFAENGISGTKYSDIFIVFVSEFQS